LREIFKHCGLKIIRSFSEDISHSLKDFGLLPSSPKEEDNDKFNLDVYDKKSDNSFLLSIDEINSYENHPSAKSWKIMFHKYRKEIFKFRFPYYLPLGHQQHVYARKV
jgi:hypothetical protein